MPYDKNKQLANIAYARQCLAEYRNAFNKAFDNGKKTTAVIESNDYVCVITQWNKEIYVVSKEPRKYVRKLYLLYLIDMFTVGKLIVKGEIDDIAKTHYVISDIYSDRLALDCRFMRPFLLDLDDLLLIPDWFFGAYNTSLIADVTANRFHR